MLILFYLITEIVLVPKFSQREAGENFKQQLDSELKDTVGLEV